MTLRHALPSWDSTVAALGRRLYGRSMHLLPETSTMLRWQSVRASRAVLQICIESGGEFFEVQWVDNLPADWPGELLHPLVPPGIRRAAFEAIVQPVWSRLTELFGLDATLIGVDIDQAVWEPHESLGFALVPANSSQGPHLHGLLRASSPAGWVLLAAWAPPGLPLAWLRDAQRIELTVHCPPVSLTRAEVLNLSIDDVVLLDPGLGTISRLVARLKLSDRWIPGVRCMFLGHAVMITQTQARKERIRAEAPLRKAPDMSTSTDVAPTVDALPVWVDLELARLPLSIEQLRGLSIGQVFELDTSLDPALVVLKCGGHRLGLGQLVAVGERLGVRLVELATPATPTASQVEGVTA